MSRLWRDPAKGGRKKRKEKGEKRSDKIQENKISSKDGGIVPQDIPFVERALLTDPRLSATLSPLNS